MSRTIREQKTLGAYHDGELGWWARQRFEAHLRRSPTLRRELALLQEIGAAARSAEARSRAPALWDSLAPGLRSVDLQLASQSESEGRRRFRISLPFAFPLPSPFPLGWKPLGAVALAAASAVALALALRTPLPGPLPAPTAGVAVSGTVRFLDTGGRPVMLMQESEDVTIIWLLDVVNEEV